MLRSFRKRATTVHQKWFRRRPTAAPAKHARSNRLLFESLEPRMVLDAGPLVISEFMAINDGVLRDGDGQFRDWVEIHNRGDEAVALNGWYLTDDDGDLTKWQFPAGAAIEGDGYLVVFASDKYPNGPAGELHTNYKLSSEGEYLGLVRPDGVTVEFSYSPVFPPQYTDVSYGLSPDFTTEGYFLESTPRRANVGEPVADPNVNVVISEIMYHPSSHSDLEEYIELYNAGLAPVNLADWQLADGVQFTFPNVTINAGQYLVVAADLEAFAAKYPTVTNVVGGWTDVPAGTEPGVLSDAGENIQLVTSTGVSVDQVEYSDSGDWAVREEGVLDRGHSGWIWAEDHDGGGKSLELINPAISNNYGQNWAASVPDQGTPGAPNSVAAADIAPMILDVTHWPVIPRASDAVTVTARLRDESAGATATVYYRNDGAPAFSSRGDGRRRAPRRRRGGRRRLRRGVACGSQRHDRRVLRGGDRCQAPANTRTFPAPARMWPAPDAPVYGQWTNLLYQVNDTFDPNAEWVPGSQPTYYMIMTEVERAELAFIGTQTNGEEDSNAEFNGTFISVDGTDTELRYNVGIRNRGHGTRTGPPNHGNNYHVNFANDDQWKDVGEINFNAQYTHAQIIGGAIFRMAGLAAPDTAPAQLRVNGANLATYGDMYGVYVELEGFNSDFADKHFPDDPDGNLYQCFRTDSGAYEEADLRWEGPTSTRTATPTSSRTTSTRTTGRT